MEQISMKVADNVLKDIDKFIEIINKNIGFLRAERWFFKNCNNEINIQIYCESEKEDKLAYYVYSKMYIFLKESRLNRRLFNLGESHYVQEAELKRIGFNVNFDLSENPEDICNRVLWSLTKALYCALDEAKVEYAFHVEQSFDHEIPQEVFWELDKWNEDCVEDDQKELCIADENINTYKIKKEWLMSVCLGYYSLDLSLLESDIIPELIGIVFETTENFCYVTSWEDEDWIYIYTPVELDDDNIFEIEEGLFNLISSISNESADMTVEDFYSYIVEK